MYVTRRLDSACVSPQLDLGVANPVKMDHTISLNIICSDALTVVVTLEDLLMMFVIKTQGSAFAILELWDVPVMSQFSFITSLPCIT